MSVASLSPTRSAEWWERKAPQSPAHLTLESLLHDVPAVIGGVVVLLLGIVAICAPFLSAQDPVAQDVSRALSPPTADHWFGTDGLGRDVLSRIMYGARVSMSMGFVSVAISLALGVPMGLMAGYYGGWLEQVILRVMDVLLAFPGILLTLVVVAVLGVGLLNAMIAVGLSAVPVYVRVVRASTLSAVQDEYVTAARAVGGTASRIMWVHILPNILSPILVISTLRVAAALLIGATLSYLGLGAQPPAPEWGSMLSDSMLHVRRAWWLGIFPGMAILVTVLGMNLFGDGLRDALDPRLRR